MDLRVMTSGDGDAITRMLLDTTDLLCDIVQARVPVVAACTGHAVAGGAVLLLATDLRVGAPGDHRFGFNEVAAGFAMPDVGLLFARHRLTPSAALHSLLFSALVDPQRALSDGYLDEVADDPVARAVERARTAAAFDSYAFAHTKERLNGALVAALGDARARIQSESAAVVLDPGHRTGA
jgi:enoyl-CoA hydratase